MDAYTHEKITNYKTHFDSLFPSSLVPLFEREFKCEPILMKMTLDLHENETACRTHFHMKGFPLRLALTQTHKRTRKWPIDDPLLHSKGQRERIMWPHYPVRKPAIECSCFNTLNKTLNNNLWLEKSPQVNLSLLLHLRKQNNEKTSTWCYVWKLCQ